MHFDICAVQQSRSSWRSSTWHEGQMKPPVCVSSPPKYQLNNQICTHTVISDMFIATDFGLEIGWFASPTKDLSLTVPWLTLQKTDESALSLSSMFGDCPFTMIEDIFSLQGKALFCTKIIVLIYQFFTTKLPAECVFSCKISCCHWVTNDG